MPNSISQGACQQLGWGLRNRAAATGAGPRPPCSATAHSVAPRVPSRGAPATAGHLLPEPGRTRALRRLGIGRLTPPRTHARRPPARALSLPPAPFQFPATAPSPSCPPFWTSGTVAHFSHPDTPPPPSPPPPRQFTSVPWSRPDWAPLPGEGSRRALARARRAEGLLSKRTHIIHAKLIPAASRPPARGCAPSLAKPRSLHPPPPPPPGGGVPGSAGDGTSRESCKMSTLWAKRGGRRQGRAGPPLPLHFYRRRKRVRPGHRSPRLCRPPARLARPGPLPGRCLPPSSGRTLRASGEHPTEWSEKPPSLPTALTATTVRKLETVPGA
ncbi:uncharacterized protein [Saccopteryx bilineata]|uniref:uncharacterized protein n=1 Tax=Saccopteryx bilineata TaxID=59482 RepID=UPI00338D3748